MNTILHEIIMTAKVFNRWTPEELLQLHQELKEKKTLEEIATTHKRSAAAVTSRRKMLVEQYVSKEAKTLAEVSELLSMTEKEIQDTLDESKKKKVAKKKDSEHIIILRDVQAKLNKLIADQAVKAI